MTQPQQSQRTTYRIPEAGIVYDTVLPRPQPAEAVCDGDGSRDDEPEVGSAEKLHPDGRQAALSELDDVA